MSGEEGGSESPGGTNVVVKTVVPEPLQPLVDLGPATWLQKRLVEFVLAFIFGVVARVSGAIEAGWRIVTDAVTGGASEAYGGFAFVGNAAGNFGLWILSQVEAAVSLAGPLAPLVWMILVALVVIATYRLGKALLTLVNLDSLLQLIDRA